MWFWYALLAAIVAAVSININKHILGKVSTLAFSWSLFTFPIPILLVITALQGQTQVSPLFFVGIIGSGTVFVVSKTISLRAYKYGKISLLAPLNAFSSLFIYLWGLIFLGEQITAPAFLGLLLILVGAYSLNAAQMHESLLTPFKLLFKDKTSLMYIFSMLLVSFSAMFDKVALTHTQPGNPLLVLLGENIFMASVLTLYIISQNRPWLTEVKNHFIPLLGAGAVYLMVGLLVFSGFLGGPIALVSGVKKLEILLAMIIGIFLFKDKPSKYSWAAAAFMISGVVLVKF